MARALVGLRLLVVAGWAVAAVAAVLFLPTLGSGGASPLEDIVPRTSAAKDTAERSAKLFAAPVSSDVSVVERDPRGLSRAELLAGARAASGAFSGRRADGLLGAVPLVNLPVAGARWPESGTTVATFLFLDPGLNLVGRRNAARAYRSTLAPGPGTRVGITGAAPARLAQFDVIEDALPIVEVATLAVILLLVALYFRSLGAPLVTLGTAGLAYLLAVRVLAYAGERAGVEIPQEIEPVLAVLLLGLATDYSVFFLAEGRRRLLAGDERLAAARAATARVGPAVLTAGLVVAACSAALRAGRLDFFRVFGPGMALCALVVTAVSVTLLPALLGLFGPRLFGRGVGEVAVAPAGDTGEHVAAPGLPSIVPGRERLAVRLAGTLGAVRAARRAAYRSGGSVAGQLAARLMASRLVSLFVVAACVAGLGWAAREGLRAELGVSYVRALPPDTEARTAGDDAARGFGPGILAPAEIVLEGRGIGARHDPLARLQRLIAERPGLAAVVGPDQQSVRRPALFVSRDDSGARVVVTFRSDPTGATAIGRLRELRRAMPGLLRRAGLPASTRVSYGGETALAGEMVDAVVSDLWRIGIAVAVVTILLLAVFLRALVAPLLLLAAGGLGFAASVGLTELGLDALTGRRQITYYVPLVALVLVMALGSDYNVLIAGRIRDEARRRRLREAIAVAAPQASRAITVAGLTLAASFALLAIVPLRPFRELAMLLAIGVLVDALIVRPLLVPGLISLAGRAAWWPGRATRPPDSGGLLEAVARSRGVSDEEAAGIAAATLHVLGARIGGRQARELAAHLADPMSKPLLAAKGREPFGYSEFVSRVAELEGRPERVAEEDAIAVMAAVAAAIPASELDYVRAALTEDYRPLLGDSPTAPARGPDRQPA